MASMCPTSAQQTTTTTAGVSPWAQNYVNTMLGAAGQQVFNMQKDPTTGAMTATGIKPYIPFGAPMNAQGDVVPYGGQQGMGWNMYGGTPQTQGYGQYAPQGQQPAAPMANLAGKQLPSQGIGAAQTRSILDPRNMPKGGFKSLQEYFTAQNQGKIPDWQEFEARNAGAPTQQAVTGYPTGTNTQATDVSPEAFKNTQAYQDFMKGTEGAMGTMDMYQSPYFGYQSSGSIGRAMDSAYEKWKQFQQGPQTISNLEPEWVKNFNYQHSAEAAKADKEWIRQHTQGLANQTPQAQPHFAPSGSAPKIDVAPEAFKNAQAIEAPAVIDQVDPRSMPEEGFESWQQPGATEAQKQGNVPSWRDYEAQIQGTPAQQTVTGYPTGTMQAGMGPGEQIAARASVAGPSALQQKAYETAYGMQTPGQYGQATDIAQAAGLGLLNTAGQAQGLQSLAQQAIQQGRQYGQDITDPYRTQAFMSPYMQNVVAAQQREAMRQSDIAAQGLKSQATKAGAFGGARQAIMEAERQRNLATQMGDIQAQGLQAAFQNAQQQQLAAQQQAMQGYTAGIQGYGQGISGQTGAYGQAAGAGTALGGLGGQQLSSAQTIANLQNLYGQQQQQNQQNVINQAMQNYQMQRLYPQQQIQYMSSLLSGLPVSSSGQVANIPGPNLLSQLGGLGTAAVGAYGLYNKLFPGGKKGGNVRSDAGGGIASIGLSKALKN